MSETLAGHEQPEKNQQTGEKADEVITGPNSSIELLLGDRKDDNLTSQVLSTNTQLEPLQIKFKDEPKPGIEKSYNQDVSLETVLYEGQESLKKSPVKYPPIFLETPEDTEKSSSHDMSLKIVACENEVSRKVTSNKEILTEAIIEKSKGMNFNMNLENDQINNDVLDTIKEHVKDTSQTVVNIETDGRHEVKELILSKEQNFTKNQLFIDDKELKQEKELHEDKDQTYSKVLDCIGENVKNKSKKVDEKVVKIETHNKYEVSDLILSEEQNLTENELFSDDQDLKHERKLNLLDKDLINRLTEMPEVLEYIRKLEKIIEKQLKKIIKWRRKAKQKSHKTRDAFTQTENDTNFVIPSSKSESNTPQELKLPVNQQKSEDEPKSLVDDITEAAENALQHSGFVYEETSGMYYDYNTGYYYNAEYRLYYDGNTGTYLSYNQDTNIYEFHSQVSVVDNKKTNRSKRKMKRKTDENKEKEAKRQKKEDQDEDEGQSAQEEGECSDSSGAGTSSEVEVDKEDGSSSEEDGSDLSKQWPPCMRIIVEQTEDSKLKVGSLHIITCDGGSIGREGDHSIIIKDINVSKHHLKIGFDKDNGKYMISDLGSRNGTLLNGNRMSVSKQESDPQEVVHGSRIQIGSTVLLCHIHSGSQTCGHCEPGLLVQKTKKEVATPKPHSSVSQRHKTELRSLKMKQGLLGFNSDGENIKLKAGYTDRAQKRREVVGSQNPYEKTESASLEKNISSENKGFKLLQKMGWKEGQSLGKGDGLLEPVPMISNPGTAGIGNTNLIPPTVHLTNAHKTKKVVWKKTQERFDKLPDTKPFLEEDSE